MGAPEAVPNPTDEAYGSTRDPRDEAAGGEEDRTAAAEGDDEDDDEDHEDVGSESAQQSSSAAANPDALVRSRRRSGRGPIKVSQRFLEAARSLGMSDVFND